MNLTAKMMHVQTQALALIQTLVQKCKEIDLRSKKAQMLGAVGIFLVVFGVLLAILGSQVGPEASVDRGFMDAEAEYKTGNPGFLAIGNTVPGLSNADLEGKYKDYAPYRGFMAGFGQIFSKLGLKLRGYEYNKTYVSAYNMRLKTLIKKNPKKKR